MQDNALLKAIDSLKESFAKENALDLRLLSNELIKKAALENSHELASIALVAYSLHKVMNKEHHIRSPKWKTRKKAILSCIEKAHNALKKNDSKAFHKSINSIAFELQRMDRFFGRYVQSIFDKARVKCAADAYFFGLSLSQAADLTHTDRKAVQEYIGFTRSQDKNEIIEGIGKRLNAFKKAIGEVK